VGQTRLKSSFIYLANAVNDLRGNWATLALVLAPLVIVAALLLLPDALNLQHGLAVRFEPGTRNIAYFPVQMPYAPSIEDIKPLFPRWVLMMFHAVLLLLTFVVNLVVLCTIRRIQAGTRHPQILNEAVEIYREATALVPAFFWILLLQLLAVAVGFVLLIIPGLVAIIWLYFAQYALVFDNLHSVPALLHSRDLMRKRFFKVATRIIVFLAVWSGFNSWVGGAFFAVSLLLGPIGALTGTLSATVFGLDLVAAGVGFTTTAFFIAAGVRLYEDLTQIAGTEASAAREVELPPTAPLPSVSA
jgi:hypothetical protein